jgi:hypothetical protein
MKRTTVPLAVVAALGVAVAIPTVGHSQTQRTITLHSHNNRVHVVDLPPRGKSSAGDLVTSTERLLGADGARVGTGYIRCNLTGKARTFETSTYECTGALRLRDGEIAYAGVARLANRVITVPVTGGTGAYSGATGELVNTSTGENTSTEVITLK